MPVSLPERLLLFVQFLELCFVFVGISHFSECPTLSFQCFLLLSRSTDIVITHDKIYEEIDLTTNCIVAFAVHESGLPSALLVVVSSFNPQRLRFVDYTGGDVFEDE